MTLISNIFFNLSEILLRDIALANGYTVDFANVEAYIRITSWWLGMGIALISFFYFLSLLKEFQKAN